MGLLSKPIPRAPFSGRLPIMLLVEDNPKDVRLVREVLADRQLECQLLVAGTGEEALRMLRREGPHAELPVPDLVLLDINLPVLSGVEVLEQVKADSKLRLIPVVMLSTSSADSDVLQCYALHANSYLVKPPDFDEFSNMIGAVHAFWMKTAHLSSAAAGSASRGRPAGQQ